MKLQRETKDVKNMQAELLAYFMEHKGWVLTRETLFDRIWGPDYFGGTRVVDNHIKKLRSLLGAEGKHIKTVISQGYKMSE